MNAFNSRTPPGVRELKLPPPSIRRRRRSRTPPGVRELKLYCKHCADRAGRCRTPPGVRELKPVSLEGGWLTAESHPSRGA